MVAAIQTFVIGCAAPRDPWFDRMLATSRVAPATPAERAALLRLDELEAEGASTVEGQRVFAGEAYVAASGRVCRPVRIGRGPERLACREPRGDDDRARPAWYFAPEVVVSPSGAQSLPEGGS